MRSHTIKPWIRCFSHMFSAGHVPSYLGDPHNLARQVGSFLAHPTCHPSGGFTGIGARVPRSTSSKHGSARKACPAAGWDGHPGFWGGEWRWWPRRWDAYSPPSHWVPPWHAFFDAEPHQNARSHGCRGGLGPESEAIAEGLWAWVQSGEPSRRGRERAAPSFERRAGGERAAPSFERPVVCGESLSDSVLPFESIC